MSRNEGFLLEDERTFQRIAYLIGVDSFYAEDLAQEVRLAVWKKTGTIPSYTKLDAYTRRGLIWLARSAARKLGLWDKNAPILPNLREDESFDSFVEERLPAYLSVEAQTLRNEQLALGLRLLSEGLLSLSVDLRHAWILRKIVDLDYPEIATILAIKKTNARKIYSRADCKLQEFFTQHQCEISPCQIVDFLLSFHEVNPENADYAD